MHNIHFTCTNTNTTFGKVQCVPTITVLSIISVMEMVRQQLSMWCRCHDMCGDQRNTLCNIYYMTGFNDSNSPFQHNDTKKVLRFSLTAFY